ncbi:MAG: EF-P lysine aminoacylase GenX [Planctomycetes bacterium]|nr:EF-P lysine aminoacylase GenX [Planctomycetota bacterium]
MPVSDYLPTASLLTLRHRALLLSAIRRFFEEAGYFEVETPLLSADIVVDAWLEPFVTDFLPLPRQWAQGGEPRYLQTSPESAMKRLLAAGATAIYQLGKVFRNGEIGQQHNPEFTMVEWYRVGVDHHAQMKFTESLVQTVFATANQLLAASSSDKSGLDRMFARVASAQGFERLSYDDAFERYTGRKVLDAPLELLWGLARERELTPPPALDAQDRDGWLNWLLAELVEPHLGRDRPTFLYHYPGSQAALSRTTVVYPGGPVVAERFELYIDGVELCNGYHELTDPAVLRERICEQSALRSASGLRSLPSESRLLEAMDHGLPASSGNALGVDRLIMLALGKTCLADVIAFPFDRA